VTPMILGRLQEHRAVGTASFEVLVLPPLLSSTGWVVGHCSRHSKTPSCTGAHVEAFIARSSVCCCRWAVGRYSHSSGSGCSDQQLVVVVGLLLLPVLFLFLLLL
jgi:hypothetical protein